MALTRYLHDHGTLVGQYLYQRYPHTVPAVRAANRPLAASTSIHPADEHYPWAVAARAIGLRLRAEFAPLPVGSLVAARGAQMLAGLADAPYPIPVAATLLDELGTITHAYHDLPHGPPEAERLDRACAVLALLEDLARTRRLAESALTDASLSRTLPSWLALPAATLVADIGMMAAGMVAQHGALFTQPGVLFPRLGPLRGAGGALDPLLVGDTLYLIKATTQPAIMGIWLRELVGYSLLDLNDHYHIGRVGLLLPRQSAALTWSLADLAQQLAGEAPAPLAELRREFAQVRRVVGEPLTSTSQAA
ncbi:MAG: hypothetical protein H0X24_04530 [Ktedonobacterales bacterium]|nr:hypothetical protein [Ktedonobacterales bacterium]